MFRAQHPDEVDSEVGGENLLRYVGHS
jgi:hypothetical protein